MALSSGSRLGAYEILSLLGSGGMGEVYRARDGKLKRDVALKVLPEIFARDHDRMSRLQREAELLASLNHPHIAASQLGWDVDPNGKRFLMVKRPAPSAISVVLNWTEELKHRVPTK